MSLPVVGSVIMSVLMHGNFGESRKHWRVGLVPTPSSQATTLILGHDGFDNEGSGSDVESCEETLAEPPGI